MEKHPVVLVLCLLIGLAGAQMPLGEFRALIYPSSKSIKPGGSIGLEAGIFSVSGRSSWNSAYRIQRENLSAPDTFLVLINSTYVPGYPVSLVADYYGPTVSIKGENPGYYVIRFDSTSQFKVDMADTVGFTVLPTTGIHPALHPSADGIPKHRYEANGRNPHGREAMPIFSR